MNPAERERRIQDFLDDRLSVDERRAFEAEMERDADLAAEVADAAALGEVLRSLDAPLPDGFHDRAAARFREAERGRRGFSWEALGLAAAALVLGAILVPWNRPAPEPPVVEAGEAPAPTFVAEGRREEAAEGREEVAAEAPVAAPEKAAPPPAAEAPRPKVAPRQEPKATEGDFADAASRRPEAEERPALAPAGARAKSGAAPVAATMDEVVESRPVAAATEAPVGPVEDERAWSRMLGAASDRSSLAALAPDFSSERIVVVAGPADCPSTTVQVGVNAVTLVLAAGEEPRCAVRVPIAPPEIRVVRPGGPAR